MSCKPAVLSTRQRTCSKCGKAESGFPRCPWCDEPYSSSDELAEPPGESGKLEIEPKLDWPERGWRAGLRFAGFGFLTFILVLIATSAVWGEAVFWLTVGLLGLPFSPSAWLDAFTSHGRLQTALAVLAFPVVLLVVGVALMIFSVVIGMLPIKPRKR